MAQVRFIDPISGGVVGGVGVDVLVDGGRRLAFGNKLSRVEARS